MSHGIDAVEGPAADTNSGEVAEGQDAGSGIFSELQDLFQREPQKASVSWKGTTTPAAGST